MKRSLILFARAPVPGRVKTRLMPDLTPDQAGGVYRAFVQDLLESTGRLEDVRRVVGCDPSAGDPFFRSLAKRYAVDLVDQRGVDLGRRMHNALSDELTGGKNPVVLIGTDCPTLPITIVREAFTRLESVDLVLGPSLDGGYYLIGCSGGPPPVFDGIPWGTDRVLALTLEKLARLGTPSALLPFWYDVDSIQDLRFLSAHLEYLNRNGRVAPETTRILKELDLRAG